MKKGVILIGTGLLLTGVGLFITEQIKMAKSLCYSFGSLKTPYITLDKAVLSILMKIKNNSSKFKANVISVSVKAYLNDVYVGTITSNKSITIEKQTETQLPLEFTFNPKEVFNNATSIIVGASSLDSVKLSFSGRIYAKKGLLPLIIPFDLDTTVGEIKSSQGSTTC